VLKDEDEIFLSIIFFQFVLSYASRCWQRNMGDIKNGGLGNCLAGLSVNCRSVALLERLKLLPF
jgi:hypothetical protein